jgi:hypothetical protein
MITALALQIAGWRCSPIDSQNSHLIGQLVGGLRKAAIESKESDSPLGFGDPVEMLESQVEAPLSCRAPIEHDPNHDDDDLVIHPSIFDFWPDEDEMGEPSAAHALLRDLDPISVARLMRFAQDEKFSEVIGFEPGLVYAGPVLAPFSAALVDRGFIETTGRFPRGRPRTDGPRAEYAVLTELGKVAARLLLPPD